MQARTNIVRFQIGEIDKNLRLGNAGCEHLEDVGDTNTHATNAGAATALERVECDSVERCGIHAAMICLTVLDTPVCEGVDQLIIMLTGHGIVEMCRRAFKSGAAEFLEKPVDDEALLEALQNAVRQHVRSRERNNADREARDRYALLSEREREVLGLIVAGLTNMEIGRVLTLSPRTVETHRANLFAKLEVESLAVLIRRFAGVVELP